MAAVGGAAGDGDGARSWARLVPLNLSESKETESVYIKAEKFYVGRSPGNDLCLAGNMHISGKHGAISKMDDGTVTYSDFSANGTVVDGQKLTKGMTAELKNGDEIHFVFKKNSAANVAYAFELIPESPKDGGCNTLDYDDEGTLDEASSPQKKANDDPDDAATSPSASKRPRLEAADDLEETMKCLICQEILHCCVSLQPCLHTFCGGCYADWRPVSSQCPTCRAAVTCFAKNHMVQNLVDAYLKSYPDKRRPKEVTDELDEKFKTLIPHLGMRPKSRSRRTDSRSDDEEHDDDDDDEAPAFTDAMHLSSHALITVPSRAFTFPVCRECRGFVPASVALGTLASSSTGAASSSAASPSTSSSGSAVRTDRPPFECAAGQPHIVCWCCLQMMPDRSADIAAQPSALPHQHCSVCHQPYCGAYWQCEKLGCSGCLVRLKDLTVDDRVLSQVVLKNQYESGILKEYLTRNDKTGRDFVAECCAKLDARQYTLGSNYSGSLVGRSVSGSSYVCRRCGLSVLSELAYQYRRDISGLPDCVMRRPNCHWGKNCRTQSKSPDHAARYNHLCEQTRWT